MASVDGVRRFLVSERAEWAFPGIDTFSSPHTESANPPRAPKKLRGGIIVSLGAIGLAVVVGAAGVVWSSLKLPVEEVIRDASSESSQTFATEDPRELVIHVSGEVMSPGIISLAEGSRVIDAVERAGGHTTLAALDAVNLARLVIDGEHLVIPAEGEEVVLSGAGSGLVSLSLASETELQELPGVGPAIASRIVSWREANGPFRHVDDILAVSGIGPATLEKFRDRVTP